MDRLARGGEGTHAGGAARGAARGPSGGLRAAGGYGVDVAAKLAAEVDWLLDELDALVQLTGAAVPLAERADSACLQGA